MESNGWVQKSHRSWEHSDGGYIVHNYCPREGGTVYTLMRNNVTTKHRTLKEAQDHV